MNANPPINVGLGQQRRQRVVQKLMAQAAQRRAAPGAQAQSQGGGRLISGRGKLPMPHITRQTKLTPALIAQLGVGGQGIPDDPNAIGDQVSGNIHDGGQQIPDWTSPPAPSDAGIPATPALTTAIGNAKTGFDPSAWIQTGGGDPNHMPAGALGTDTVMGHPPPVDNSLIHLGNGLFYDPATDAVRGGGPLARTP